MIVVAQDGTGDFLTIQEAIVSLPELDFQHQGDAWKPFEYRKIFIKQGKYKERITLDKPYVELIGEEVTTTSIVYDLYANMPWDDIGKLGTFRSHSFLIDSHDVIVKNLTIENSSGSGKAVGQAIAMYVDGDRIMFDSCRFTSDCPKGTVYLGRPWRNFAQTVILNSYIGEHIRPEGWHDWNKVEAKTTVFYGEYNNFGPGADITNRVEWMKQLKDKRVDNADSVGRDEQGNDIVVKFKEQNSYWQKERVLAGDDGWKGLVMNAME